MNAVSSPRLETFMARLFVDPAFREDFLRDAVRMAEEQGLDDGERQTVLALDRTGLMFAARSFAAKRDAGLRAATAKSLRSWWRRLVRRRAP